MKYLLTACTALILTVTGCSKEKATEPPQKSNVQVFIEGATGKTAVEQGKKAQQQIREISTKESKDLEEAMK